MPVNFGNFENLGEYQFGHSRRGVRDLYNQVGQVSGMYDDMMSDWSKYVTEFRGAERFPLANLNRQADQNYFQGLASVPSIGSSLKGMGVDAAEGQANLMASLPMMQARNAERGQNTRDNYTANMAYLTQLGNTLGIGMDRRQAGINTIMNYQNMLMNERIQG